MYISIIFLGLINIVFSGVREFFDPNEAATPSILKYLDKYDLDQDKKFTKEEYPSFLFEVIYEELITIGFSVPPEQRDDLKVCIKGFANGQNQETFTYEHFWKDFQLEFIGYLDNNVDKCPISRVIWKSFFKEQPSTNQRRKRKLPTDL